MMQEPTEDRLQRAYLAGVDRGHREMLGLVGLALLAIAAVSVVALLG